MLINIDYTKCIGIKCLDCLDICPMNVFTLEDNTIVTRSSLCCGCQACIDECYYNAISMQY
ncbi:MAG: ferredoxin [Methanosphaera sp.]|nr:ferredoxin [Methanosphaera sp.]